ncbi:MAG: hypothetical protein IPK54_14575 [Dokdonella sp.]|uniref:hypothetical protein n=1 Tax=Dokdonella sp. TaxID=2291710 RepID=UPI0025BCCACD|nr:hypothetical protein [Dokdonella sp.]MBK8124761.1 hypothetical protein [Dokdonella sp.]
MTGNAGPAPQYEFRYAGKLPAMDVDADGKTDLLTVSQLPGAKAFAVKMCTIKRVRQIGTETCPAGAEHWHPQATSPKQPKGLCAAYSPPPTQIACEAQTMTRRHCPEMRGGHPLHLEGGTIKMARIFPRSTRIPAHLPMAELGKTTASIDWRD